MSIEEAVSKIKLERSASPKVIGLTSLQSSEDKKNPEKTTTKPSGILWPTQQASFDPKITKDDWHFKSDPIETVAKRDPSTPRREIS